VGYLGSLVGLDPTETGPHGPWLLRIGGAGRVELEHLPMAPLRWEEVRLDVDGWDEPATDLDGALLDTLTATMASLDQELPAAGALGLTVRLVGRCRDYGGLAAAVAARPEPFVPAGGGQPAAFLARLVDETRPARDLAALARTADPAGLLARRLLALEADDRTAGPLLEQAREVWSRRAHSRPFARLQQPRSGSAALREALLRAGYEALERLLDEKGGGHAPA
jgi:hypothetical protein